MLQLRTSTETSLLANVQRLYSQGRLGFPGTLDWTVLSQHIPECVFPKGPSNTEKRNCCEWVEWPLSGRLADLLNG